MDPSSSVIEGADGEKRRMKIYTIDYWGRRAEYGGIVVVLAEDRDELKKIMLDEFGDKDEIDYRLMLTAIKNAEEDPVDKSGLVAYYET
jgi:hypothetical protein